MKAVERGRRRRRRRACSSTSSSAATSRSSRTSTASSSRCRSRSPARTSSTSSTATSSASTSRASTRDFSKVLVRYNPDGDAEMNERQLGTPQAARRLAARATTASSSSSCSCPAEHAQLEQVGGDTDRYDAELRPELMRRAIEEIQDFGIEVDIWKIEGVDEREDAEMLAEQTRKGEGRENVVCVLLGRGASDEKVDHWLRAGRARRGLRRLRHRPLDLVGRAEGLPRRRASSARRPPSRSPTTTCASSRSTRTPRPARYRRVSHADAAEHRRDRRGVLRGDRGGP